MSKLLKRTLTFALIFCMLLSVIPAASAEETKEALFFQFTNSSQVKYHDATAPIAEFTEAGSVAAGRNWWIYHVGQQWYANYVGTDALGVRCDNTDYKSRTVALGIHIDEEGLYDVIAGVKSSADMRLAIIKLDETSKTKLVNGLSYTATTTTGSRNWSCLSSYINSEANIFDVGIEMAHGRKPGYYFVEAYLGQVQLTPGDYAIIPYHTAAGTINIRNLILSKAGDGLAMNKALEVSEYGGARYTALMTDYVAPNAALIGSSNSALDLNGYTATVKNVALAAVVDFSANNTGILNVAEKAVFYSNNAAFRCTNPSQDSLMVGQIPLYTAATKSYKFSYNTPSVATKSNTSYTNPLYNAGDNTVQFAAKFVVEDDVRQAIAAGGSGFQMQMYWQVGDNDPVTAILADATAAAWAAETSTDVLQITLKGLEELEAGTVIKCTPRVIANGAYYTGTTLSYTVEG